MSVTMTPLAGGSVSGAYLDVPEARSLGATLPGADLAALLAKSDDELAVLLLGASIDIDAAMPYQGAKYAAGQVRQFPRVSRVVDPDPRSGSTPTGADVWDWDDQTQTAVVPIAVKTACLYQAASLLDETHRARLDAIRSGLAAQRVGSLSESYLKPADLPGGLNGLCDRAQRLMDPYRLRTAELL